MTASIEIIDNRSIRFFFIIAEDTILEKEIKKIATQFDSTVQRGNWIFNLAQGLDKNTPISKIELTIQTVRNL